MKPISRRSFIERTGSGIAVGSAIPALKLPLEVLPAPKDTAPAAPRTRIRLTVNGKLHKLEVEDRWSLAEVLRDHLRLTGTKIGCDRSECGACTVIMEGKTIYACSYLAVWADGREITTVEGLARGEKLDPVQQAFIDQDGPQCGFCTSGQLMSARALLDRNPNPSIEEIRRGMAGNICRCSNYNHYLEAVLAAAQKGRKS